MAKMVEVDGKLFTAPRWQDTDHETYTRHCDNNRERANTNILKLTLEANEMWNHRR